MNHLEDSSGPERCESSLLTQSGVERMEPMAGIEPKNSTFGLKKIIFRGLLKQNRSLLCHRFSLLFVDTHWSGEVFLFREVRSATLACGSVVRV